MKLKADDIFVAPTSSLTYNAPREEPIPGLTP
jgi:hypothetical protein